MACCRHIVMQDRAGMIYASFRADLNTQKGSIISFPKRCYGIPPTNI